MVSVVMVWEFPAVSQTRIEFWKKPQFTQSGMWWFTLIFGFFGLHHFYLRSPQTGLIFLIVNFISLGYLWAYDMVQLSSSGGYTTEKLNKHGLAHPWGALGLAQGMWIEPEKPIVPQPAPAPAPAPSAPPAVTTYPPPAPPPAPSAPPAVTTYPPPAPPPPAPPPATEEKNPSSAEGEGVSFKGYNASGNPRGTMVGGAFARSQVGGAFARSQVGGAMPGEPPNPLWFLLYSLAIPCAPLAQLIAGDTNNAVSRFADLTIIPLGFIFYLCAMMYDYWVLFSNPADLLVAGSKRFFPFTYLGMDADGHSELLTGVSEIDSCPPDNFIMTMLRIGKPAISILAPGVGKTIESALETKAGVEKTVETTKKVVIDGALVKAQKASQIATQIGSLSTLPPAGMIPSTDGIAQFRNPATGQGLGTMVGGARLDKGPTFNTLDYAALGSLGAVIGGGLLLSANRFRNVFFSKGNDSPPDPRAVRENVQG